MRLTPFSKAAQGYQHNLAASCAEQKALRIIVLGVREIPILQGRVETHMEYLYPRLVTLGCSVDGTLRTPYVDADQRQFGEIRFRHIWSPQRLIQTPPLTPDVATVARRVDGVMDKKGRVSLGVSDETLQFNARAMEGMEGPEDDLHSTVWGLVVEELDSCVDACFDCVVTSSGISRRFEREDTEGRFPVNERFYRGGQTDPRFDLVYASEPARWRS